MFMNEYTLLAIRSLWQLLARPPALKSNDIKDLDLGDE